MVTGIPLTDPPHEQLPLSSYSPGTHNVDADEILANKGQVKYSRVLSAFCFETALGSECLPSTHDEASHRRSLEHPSEQ